MVQLGFATAEACGAVAFTVPVDLDGLTWAFVDAAHVTNGLDVCLGSTGTTYVS